MTVRSVEEIRDEGRQHMTEDNPVPVTAEMVVAALRVVWGNSLDRMLPHTRAAEADVFTRQFNAALAVSAVPRLVEVAKGSAASLAAAISLLNEPKS